MKIILVILLFTYTTAYTQDTAIVLKEAQNLERQLKEEEALAKYTTLFKTKILTLDILVKCAELNYSIGYRQKDKKAKLPYFTELKMNATHAIEQYGNNAAANYAMALAQMAMATVEEEDKLTAQDIRDVYAYANKAVALNPTYARAWYILGKWNIDAVNMGFAKKALVKTIYGGLPPATVEKAIAYFEKCKALEEYFLKNYLELALAYKQNNQPAKVREVLEKLIRLPLRTANDATWKEQAKKLLIEFQ